MTVQVHRALDIDAVRQEAVERLVIDAELGLKEFLEQASVPDLAAMNLVLFNWSTSQSKSLTEAIEAVFPPSH